LPAEARAERPDLHDVVWRTRALLEESVRLRLVSDVPVAVLLSGGIDSAAIATLAAQALGPTRLSTFSVTLDRESADLDEGDRARALATRIGADHHEVPLRSDEMVERMDDALAAMDQPSIDGVNTFFVTQAIHRAGVVVAMSGLGGDEVFLGYPSAHTLRRDLALARGARVPLALARPALRAAGRALASRTPLALAKLWGLPDAAPNVESLVDLRRTLFPAPLRAALAPALPDVLPPACGSGDAQLRWSRAELAGYLRNMLLRDTDVFAMHHPVEVRVPLIDHVLVEYVLGLPGDLRATPGRQKPLLVDAMGLDLPADLDRRPKTGFVLPFARWLAGPLRDRVTATLHDRPRLESLGLDPPAVARVWASFLAHPTTATCTRPWALFALAISRIA